MKGSPLLLCGLVACSSGGSVYGTAATGHTHGASGASSSGAAGSTSSTGTATGTGATTGAGGTTAGAGTTTGSVACDDTWVSNWEYDGGYLPNVADCPPNMLELKGRLANVCTAVSNGRSPPITEPFTGKDLHNPSYTATVGPCGSYWFCVPPGTQLTPTFQVTNFYDTVLATLALDGPAGPEDNEAQSGLSLFCNSLVNTTFLGTLDPAINLDQGLLAVVVERDFADAGPCNDKSGYSFALSLSDGGALSSPPWFYVDGTSFVQDDAGTSGAGIQIFYNIDYTLVNAEVSGYKPANELPDGGDECPVGSFTPGIAQFTGQIPVVSGQLTYFLWSVP